MGEVASTAIIVVLVVSSALIAFIQEYKSEKILEKLQKRVDMIDIKLLQNDFEKTSISLQKKGVSIEVLENLQTLAQNTKLAI